MATSGCEPASAPDTAAGRDARLGQQPVEQHPGSCAELAAGDPRGTQVAGAANMIRVARGSQQAVLAPPQVDDRGPPPAQLVRAYGLLWAPER